MDDFSGGLRLRAKRVMGLEEARTGLAESLRIQLRKDQLREASLRQLGELLSAHKGQCPVSIDYQGAGAKALLRLGETFKVQPGDSLIQTLRDQFGRDSVFLNYR